MRVVIAMDSFKESLTAETVCAYAEEGFRTVFPDWQYCRAPMADGGEGTVAVLLHAMKGRLVSQQVTGPLGTPVAGYFGLSGDGETAIVEVAAACGLGLVRKAERDPLRATSFGVGELIKAALDLGARRFVLGLGGSGTNDGGAGMVQALGVGLLDASGQQIGPGGGALTGLARIDISKLDPRIHDAVFDVASDVDNLLTGPNGASAVFGPQKGAAPDMVEELDANLSHYATVLREQLAIDVSMLAGGGAAGGIGAALVAFLGARLRPGAEIIAASLKLEELIAGADLVITGEGRLDGQSVRGKAPLAVAAIAKRHGKPVIALAGSLGAGHEKAYGHGVGAMFSVVSRVCTVEEALSEAKGNVIAAARNVALALKMGMSLQLSRSEPDV